MYFVQRIVFHPQDSALIDLGCVTAVSRGALTRHIRDSRERQRKQRAHFGIKFNWTTKFDHPTPAGTPFHSPSLDGCFINYFTNNLQPESVACISGRRHATLVTSHRSRRSFSGVMFSLRKFQHADAGVRTLYLRSRTSCLVVRSLFHQEEILRSKIQRPYFLPCKFLRQTTYLCEILREI